MARSKLTWILGAGALVVIAIGMAQSSPDQVGGGSGDGGLVFDDEGRGAALCEFEVTVEELNVRNAPNANAPVVGTLGTGDVITGEPTVDGGYRSLGDGRWAADQYLEATDDSNCPAG